MSVVGNLLYTFNRRTSFGMDFQRVPVQATGQYTGYYIRNDVSASIQRSLTTRLSVRAALVYEKTRFPEQLTPVRSDRFSLTDYSGLVELRYRPGSVDRPGPFLFTCGYTPQRTTSTRIDLSDVNSQRVTLSLQYGWF